MAAWIAFITRHRVGSVAALLLALLGLYAVRQQPVDYAKLATLDGQMLLMTFALTLVASLHAVELALQHFPRIIGLRDGRILFDKSNDAVTAADLNALYANDQLQRNTPAAPPAAAAVVHIPRC